LFPENIPEKQNRIGFFRYPFGGWAGKPFALFSPFPKIEGMLSPYPVSPENDRTALWLMTFSTRQTKAPPIEHGDWN
jgi:hypothetical protein